MEHEHSAGIVIFRRQNGRRLYLLLKYPQGHFDFAKGHLQAGESAEQAALRETEEETGIKDLRIVDGFQVNVFYYYRNVHKSRKNPPLSRKKVTYFLAETRKKNIKISFEHKGFVWLPYQKAIHRITFENSRNILRKAYAKLHNMPFFKVKELESMHNKGSSAQGRKGMNIKHRSFGHKPLGKREK